MSKTTRIALTVALAVFALAITGGTIGLIIAEVDDDTATATPTANPNALECANITRAYNSWAGGSRDMYDFELITAPDMRSQIDDQRELLEAVQGYTGQPSKQLATAVASLGSELAILNAELTIAGKVSADQSAVVAEKHQQVRQTYADWKAATCD